MKLFRTLLPLVLLTSLVGCSRAYFGTMESLGFPKRDLFAKRVTAAQETQEETKAQFKTALDRFRTVIRSPEGDLEEKYQALDGELSDAEERARALRSRIASVEEVSEALFIEWREELGKYQSASLRRKSEEKLQETRAQYDRLIQLMKAAESRLEPTLIPFRDNVLFLKHNLNARAVASLSTELAQVEGEVSGLIRDLDRSIAASERFINDMQGSLAPPAVDARASMKRGTPAPTSAPAPAPARRPSSGIKTRNLL